MKKKLNLFIGTLLLTSYASAQSIANGVAQIESATTQIQGLKEKISTLLYVVAGIIALVGAIKIYLNWNGGGQDVQKQIVGWVAAALFFASAGAIANGFFGA